MYLYFILYHFSSFGLFLLLLVAVFFVFSGWRTWGQRSWRVLCY